MDAQSEQIVKDIQEKREQLSDNLSALETRVREATDWRTYYHRTPWLLIGAAVVGGFFVSSMLIPWRRGS